MSRWFGDMDEWGMSELMAFVNDVMEQMQDRCPDLFEAMQAKLVEANVHLDFMLALTPLDEQPAQPVKHSAKITKQDEKFLRALKIKVDRDL
jgi:hypothetical protein